MRPEDEFLAAFPRLQGTGFAVTSPDDPWYNCLAWAAEDNSSWWEPIPSMSGGRILGGFYWPPNAPLERTVDGYVAAFEEIGYLRCDHGELEQGWQKVAIYADPFGVPKHAARQLKDGRWASKMGFAEDIEHDDPSHIGGTLDYGDVVAYLRRPR